jgi:hypothetical protein
MHGQTRFILPEKDCARMISCPGLDAAPGQILRLKANGCCIKI